MYCLYIYIYIYIYTFRYFFIKSNIFCFIFNGFWTILWRSSRDFCDFVSNFIANQIASCFCCFLNYFLWSSIYRICGGLFSMIKTLLATLTFLLMLLITFLPIFLAKYKNRIYYLSRLKRIGRRLLNVLHFG